MKSPLTVLLLRNNGRTIAKLEAPRNKESKRKLQIVKNMAQQEGNRKAQEVSGMDEQLQILDRRELMALLKVSRQTLRQLEQEGLPRIQLGSGKGAKARFSLGDVLEWLATHKTVGGSKYE